ncbi:MAG: endolytic transglycosylase MltG [Candidatus Daviesbacteria bacterium]|nr:endolytic transglycosylase MltG [Candidatus Daviesbacteria bacterium]
MKLRKLVLPLFLIVVIFFIGKAYYGNLLSPVNPSNNLEKRFIVFQGEGVASIADRLYLEKLIKSPLAFKLLAKQSPNLSENIQFGDFHLSSSQSSEEILKELTEGVVEKWVTLLEGWRVEEMAEKLNAELKIDNKEFVKAAKSQEGYLFPDTYLFDPDSSVEGIIAELKANFDKKYDSDLQQQIKSKGLTPSEGVILASIVEREARSFEVRKMVASILLKRLKIEMGLNADATIQYILGYQPEEKSWWKRYLSRDDLKIESKYNTYLHRGLPPTPIASPSLSSLKAVAEADSSTPYFYYYHDLQGNSYYSETLEEHNLKVSENR